MLLSYYLCKECGFSDAHAIEKRSVCLKAFDFLATKAKLHRPSSAASRSAVSSRKSVIGSVDSPQTKNPSVSSERKPDIPSQSMTVAKSSKSSRKIQPIAPSSIDNDIPPRLRTTETPTGRVSVVLDASAPNGFSGTGITITSIADSVKKEDTAREVLQLRAENKQLASELAEVCELYQVTKAIIVN